MGDAQVFNWVCLRLEEATPLTVLETRGTVRIALRDEGLAAQSVSVQQMTALLEKVMPAQLRKRGVADAQRVCRGIAQRLEREGCETGPAPVASPEAAFSRLGG